MRLGPFGQIGVERLAGGDLTGAVGAALDHYASQIGSGRVATRLPRCLFGQVAGGAPVEVEPDVCEHTRSLLEREAREQEVAIDDLLSHALFVYLADLSSGRCLPVTR